MSSDTVCRVCLVNNLQLHDVRNDLQNTYERITNEKFIQDGYPLCMCYICLSALRKCHRFMETARDANRLLKQCYNNKIEMGVAKPLTTYSINKLETVSTGIENISSKQDIKTENKAEQLVSDIKTENTKWDIDEDEEITDIDKQTDNSTVLVEISIEPTYNDDKQTDPLLNDNMDNEWSGLDMKSQHGHSQVRQNIEITGVKPETETNYEIKLFGANETSQDIKTETNIQEIHESDADGLVPDDVCHAVNFSTYNPKSEIFKQEKTQNEKRLHICGVCGESYTSTCNLRRHIIMKHRTTIKLNTNKNKLHQIITMYSCNECSFRCLKKYLLIRHLRTHKCTSAQTSQLTQHTIVHTGEKRFSCNICGYNSTRKAHLKSHMRTHTGEKRFACDICGFKFAEKVFLTRHMRSHTGEKPFSCNICKYKCALRTYLTMHMRTHTGEKPYSCNVCEYKCARKGTLNTHMRTHTGEKPYSCDRCEYQFSQKENLIRHMITHTGEKPFLCDICNYKCKRKEQLRTHMRTHTGEKPDSSHLTERKFTTKDLTLHGKTQTGEKSFLCDKCDYKCSRKGQLTIHTRTHTGEKPYSCNFCEHTFAQKGALTTHLRTHTGEKPFFCDKCDYKCSQKTQLTIHARNHTGEKPYSCNFCEHSFAQKGGLTAHLRTHTGEKPFFCDKCDYKCAQKYQLLRHMRTHNTGEKSFSCNRCEYKSSQKTNLTRHMKSHTA